MKSEAGGALACKGKRKGAVDIFAGWSSGNLASTVYAGADVSVGLTRSTADKWGEQYPQVLAITVDGLDLLGFAGSDSIGASAGLTDTHMMPWLVHSCIKVCAPE